MSKMLYMGRKATGGTVEFVFDCRFVGETALMESWAALADGEVDAGWVEDFCGEFMAD